VHESVHQETLRIDEDVPLLALDLLARVVTNGKLRPLGISTLRDRVCMTAAMLVLEPIFEAEL
jgi:hypothetical protein